jgi:predicted transcriptional regulator
MKRLTVKEEEIMNLFWERGPLFVKEIQETYEEPRPHVNTLSTIARILEEKGFVGHEALGKTHRYRALIDREEYSKGTLRGVVGKYFNNSYLGVVSSLINEEKLSVEELKALIEQVEKAGKK